MGCINQRIIAVRLILPLDADMDWAAVEERRITPFEGSNVILYIEAWISLCLNITLNFRFSPSWNQNLRSSPLPDPDKTVAAEK
jgi:hypothetical protein